jgi:hypothetical protein
LITAATGWGWVQGNAKRDLASDFAGNQLLVPAGLAFTGTTPDKTTAKGYAAGAPIPAFVHAGRALEAAGSPATLSKPEVEQASASLVTAAQSVPASDRQFQPRLQALTRDPKGQAIPTAKQPVKQENLAARLLVTLQGRELRRLPTDTARPHPAADTFPGGVPQDAPRLAGQSRTIQTRVPDWHSTGLYAAPGETLTIQIPESAIKQGLRLRIGAHKDVNWNLSSWTRFPEITRSVPLEAAMTRLANPFGGAVYVEVPANSRLGEVTVRISGAVAAPHYVLGRTSLEDWRQSIRRAPGPWAELESSKLIVTVPSSVVRELGDPEALMKVWDQVLDLDADLAGIPRQRLRPERIVTDQQIVAGYMHAGYPIMTWMDQTRNFVDRDHLLKGNWGILHELGHNHQVSDWTFAGTGEVTCNLFTLYVLDMLCTGKAEHQKKFTPEAMLQTHAAYVKGGARFEQWQADAFLALVMYVQLRDGFGWEAYRKVFAEYRSLPAEQRPKSEQDKRDQWMLRFSRTVNKNLGPFFQAWGIPVSAPALASVAKLPPWMPPNFPPPTP